MPVRSLSALLHAAADGAPQPDPGTQALRAELARARALAVVAECANAGAPAAALLKTCLSELCAYAGWPAGRARLLRRAQETVWYVADPERCRVMDGEGRAARGRLSLPASEALEVRRTVWSRLREPDGDAALRGVREAGLRGVLAVPVSAHGRVEAVVELFSPSAEPPAAELVQLAGDMARQAAFRLAREERPDRGPVGDHYVRTAMEAMPLPRMMMFPDGTVTLWNRAAEAAFGWRADEVVGTRPAVDDECWGPLSGVLREVAASGEALTVDVEIVTREGATLTVHATAAPVRGADGSIVSTVTGLEDVTEQRELEQRHERLLMLEHVARVRAETAEQRSALLAYASEVLDASFEYLQGGSTPTLSNLAHLVVPTLADYCRVDLLDADGGYQPPSVAHSGPAGDTNAAWPAEGHPVERVVRSGQRLLLADPAPSAVDALFARPELRAGLPAQVASLMVVPLIARGRAMGALTLAVIDSGRRYDREDLLLAQDLARRTAMVLENARLFHEATAAGRWRDELLAMVSHDLRNPLNVVAMGAQALLHAWPDGEPSRKAERGQLELMSRSARQMRRMLDDLLDVAQVDAGRLRVTIAEVPAPLLVLEAMELNAPLADDRGVEMRVCLPSETGRVLADRDRVLQVLSNLLGNACKFTPRGGCITLSAQTRRQEVCFSVADTGPGIAPDLLPHVFDRFFRGQQSGRSGVGLGLAIAKGIVDVHGGRIWAESTPGEGTTFHFTLPRCSEPAPSTAAFDVPRERRSLAEV